MLNRPEQWLFAQEEDRTTSMWDFGVRKALKIAAVDASAIEASKIAGHGSVNMTNDYMHVHLKRQDELTRAIQERLGGGATNEGASDGQ